MQRFLSSVLQSRLSNLESRISKRIEMAQPAEKVSMSRRFARWAAGLKYEDVPPEVVDKVKALMLHALASAGLGAAHPNVKEAVRLAKAEEGKPDGATILLDGGKATRMGAAYAN